MTTTQPKTAGPEPETTPNLAVLPPASTRETGNSSAGNGPPDSALPDPSSSSKSRTRNGKIARLPYLERDMVNRMLRNNIPHAPIVNALDEHGFTVTQRNISNWKNRGGYRDWCLEQDRALQNRLLQDNLTEHLRRNDASQLPEVGLQLAATNLSTFFLRPDIQQKLAAEPEKFARTIAVLCRLAHQIHTLQSYRDDSAKEIGYHHVPERAKRKAEEAVDKIRSIYSAAKFGKSPAEPYTPHRNFMPRSNDP